jgi:hypothetical protein
MLRCAHIRDCSLEQSSSTNESAARITHFILIAAIPHSRHYVTSSSPPFRPGGRSHPIPSHPAPTFARAHNEASFSLANSSFS